MANIVLLTVLLFYVYRIYQEVKSKFALGLIIFVLVLLVNGIFQCPIFYKLFIPEQNCPYIPYYTVAGIFEFIALLILIYLVRK